MNRAEEARERMRRESMNPHAVGTMLCGTCRGAVRGSWYEVCDHLLQHYVTAHPRLQAATFAHWQRYVLHTERKRREYQATYGEHPQRPTSSTDQAGRSIQSSGG